MQHDDILTRVGAYWDSRSQGYAAQVDREERNNVFALCQPYFGDLPDAARVLDVGCGPGFFSVALAKMGCEVTALDFSAAMLEQTRARAEKAGVRLTAVQGDAQQLTFDDESFDVVSSRNVLWDLPNPQQACRQWWRVVKPGGRVVIFDGNHYRYLFDAEYAQVHEQKIAVPDAAHIMLGVSSAPIDAIARDLPLGRCARPDWDRAMWESLGARVQVVVLTTEKTASGKRLPQSFVVVAQKPK